VPGQIVKQQPIGIDKGEPPDRVGRECVRGSAADAAHPDHRNQQAGQQVDRPSGAKRGKQSSAFLD